MIVDFKVSMIEASIAGTCFDYLARFTIAQIISYDKYKSLSNIVSDIGLEYSKECVSDETYNRFILRNGVAKQAIKDFIDLKDVDMEVLISHIWFMSRLESIYRGGFNHEEDPNDMLLPPNKNVLEYISSLHNLFKKIFIEGGIVKSDSIVVYNPSFGLYSRMIGGADGDVFIDGTLYDFKTTVKTNADFIDLAQLWGYYMLFLASDGTSSIRDHEFNRLAFYKARYGQIEYLDLNDLGYQETFDSSRVFEMNITSSYPFEVDWY